MTFLKVLLGVFVMMSAGHVYAEETAKEKAVAEEHAAKRELKKKKNRLKEVECDKGDVKCAEEKTKHRAKEAADAAEDHVKEAADKADHDDKANH